MTKNQLTAAQLDILTVAAAHPEGRVEYFPASLRGGARKLVLKSLAQLAFIEYRDDQPYITRLARRVLQDTQAAVEHCNAVLKAMQEEAPAEPEAVPANLTPDAAPAVEADSVAAESQDSPVDDAGVQEAGVVATEAPSPAVEEKDATLGEAAGESIKGWAPKPGTKQAILLDAMRCEAGVDVEALMAATGWQKHSVRGAISTLSTMPGISITKAKVDGKIIYRCS